MNTNNEEKNINKFVDTAIKEYRTIFGLCDGGGKDCCGCRKEIRFMTKKLKDAYNLALKQVKDK